MVGKGWRTPGIRGAKGRRVGVGAVVRILSRRGGGGEKQKERLAGRREALKGKNTLRLKKKVC